MTLRLGRRIIALYAKRGARTRTFANGGLWPKSTSTKGLVPTLSRAPSGLGRGPGQQIVCYRVSDIAKLPK